MIWKEVIIFQKHLKILLMIDYGMERPPIYYEELE